jgi:predicted nucleic acid-binding protein
MKIVDASFIICIIHEAEYPKIFEICFNLGHQFIIPSTVYEELKKNKSTFRSLRSYPDFFTVSDEIDADCYEYFESRYPYLHSGELGVICLAFTQEKKGQKYTCIIDEKARKINEVKKLRLTGTLGLILWIKKSDKITNKESELIYNHLRDSNFRIKDSLLELLLK